MKPILSNERGMALAVAIFALVVVGALVAGAFFAGTQEQRVGENSRRLTQSFGAAETGLNEIIRKWDPQIINRVRQYPLDSVAVPLPANLADTLTPDGTGIFGGYVYKLNPQVYLIDITARDRKSAGGIIGGARASASVSLFASGSSTSASTQRSPPAAPSASPGTRR